MAMSNLGKCTFARKGKVHVLRLLFALGLALPAFTLCARGFNLKHTYLKTGPTV